MIPLVLLANSAALIGLLWRMRRDNGPFTLLATVWICGLLVVNAQIVMMGWGGLL